MWIYLQSVNELWTDFFKQFLSVDEEEKNSETFKTCTITK